MEIIFGSSLKEYEIVNPLGKGAYSCVYHVRCKRSGREVALKVIDKSLAARKNIVKRLRNEIKLQSTLNHPSIVSLYHSFEDKACVYLVLELCREGELHSHIKKNGRLSEDEVRNLGLQLIEGVSYLHGKGVIHRDLKLGNLLLSNGQLKIGDFGLAVKLNDCYEECSTVCGTPNYISPEIIERRPYGLASDMWSMGCVFYACLVGHPPFQSQSVQLTFSKVRQLNFEIPYFLSMEAQSLIQSLLTWDPKDRLSAGELRNLPFFTESIENSSESFVSKDYTYIEYSESVHSPTTAISFEEFSEDVPMITPISTVNLPPTVFELKHSSICITYSGTVVVKAHRRVLEIANDGLSALYEGKQLSLSEIVYKKNACRLYEYARKALDAIRCKTPKSKVRFQDSVCCLMSNTPCPNVEVDFDSGYRVLYQIGSEKMDVLTPSGQRVRLNPHRDYYSVPRNLQHLIDTTLQGLKKCVSDI